MEGVNRLYVLSCIASVFAPMQAIAEWTGHWLTVQSSLLRMLVYVPLSVPFIFAMWIVTSLVSFASAALFKGSSFSLVVSLIAAFSPWAVSFFTCYDHLYDSPAHYCVAFLLTAAVYSIESVFYSKSRGPNVSKHLQRS